MSPRWRSASWTVVSLLASINLLHYANRNVVAHKALFDDLRGLFAPSDAEIGLLLTAFIVPHALVTLPVSWLGDRFDRRRVIAGGLVLWSAAAVLSTLAWNMNSLLVARALVGVGTAACVPMANALICDVVPPERQARTIGVYNLGLFFGGVLGIAAGGALGFPWAFVAVGAPGFVLAILILRLEVHGREVKRAARGEPLGIVGAARRTVATFVADAGAVLSVVTLRWMMVGAVLMAFAAGAYVHWFIEYLIGTAGLSENEANVLFGFALIGGLAGVVVGGIVADRLYAVTRAGRQLAVSLGFAAAVPCALGSLYFEPGLAFYASACLLLFFISWYHGPIVAAVDDVVPPERAATAQGTYIAVMHLLGTAPSAWIVGMIKDASGLREALLLPTAAMAAAAAAFVIASRSAPRDAVVNS